ncbi:hypothetical protein VPH35_062820 [Triticum aestivum]|uniref:Uncharacterized protein n=1 Tax=Aegilops tauschii subsp. strangulata TaxID=200361 RepID=A0A453GHW9_AEGTS
MSQVQTPSSAEWLSNHDGAKDAKNHMQDKCGLKTLLCKVRAGSMQVSRGTEHHYSQESSSLKTLVRDVRLQNTSAVFFRECTSPGSWRCNVSRISTDYNTNRKFVRTAPAWKWQKTQDQSNRVCQSLNTVYLSEKAQGTEQTPWSSSAAQRSLFHCHVLPPSQNTCHQNRQKGMYLESKYI